MPRASEAPAAVEVARGSWGRGCRGGKPGVFRGRQSHPDAPFIHAPATDPLTDFLADGQTEFFTDCWVDFLPDGETEAIPLRFLPRPAAQRGGRVDMRVIIPPLGGHVHFTRVLALAFLGRTWEELKATHANGQYRLVVHHENEKPWDCRLGNLRVITRRQNQRIEVRRAAEGRRPPRGPGRKRKAEDEESGTEEAGSSEESEA